MRKNQSGFTLVEIAIVLVIIGLLLGGVLKGQELINSAKAKSVVNDFRNTATMIAAYQDRFRFLPGDHRGVATALQSAVEATAIANTAVGDGKIDGNWDSTTGTNESVLMWQHLRLANLATGNTASPAGMDSAQIIDWAPRNSEGGRIGVTVRPSWAGNIQGRHFICQGNLDGRIARQVDATMDDGVGDTGSVGVFTTQGTPAGQSQPVENALYTVCYGF